MMKYKPKNPKTIVLIFVTVIALIVAANFLGIGTMRSAIRIGYVGNDGWRNWSASYILLNGTMQHTIRPKTSPDILHIEVETEEGTISIEIKDTDGNIIFDGNDIGTTSYEVEVPGKVTIKIVADNHKGSFSIG